MNTYRTIIGLEIHIEPTTHSKLFCGCSAHHFGEAPNSHVCPVCLGMPGTLPVPNVQAFESGILFAQALRCTIGNEFVFARKHYTYPDLPKGYQITQFKNPLGTNGQLEIMREDGTTKSFRINRIHLEEDAGKLRHAEGETLVDFNRAGVPLLEIVTEADFDNAADVLTFLKELRLIARSLGISNADMEKGQMRLEPNISLIKKDDPRTFPDYKVEVKNINSFAFVGKVIAHEIDRQYAILEAGKTPTQETRGFDERTGTTFSQRSKENAEQYKYFPEPDIPPVHFSEESIKDITAKLGELPNEKRKRFVHEYGIRRAYAEAIVGDKNLRDEFERTIRGVTDNLLIRECAKWLVEEVPNMADAVRHEGFTLAYLPDLCALIVSGTVTTALARKLLHESYTTGAGPAALYESLHDQQSTAHSLEDIVDAVIADNAQTVADIRSGKNPNALMFLVGHVMKRSQGTAHPGKAKELLAERVLSV